MTDQEWLTGTQHPQFMAFDLSDRRVPRTKAGRRKLRLFACGCCRFIWDVLPDDRLRNAVVVAERFADGQATKAELAAARAATEGLRGVTGLFEAGPPELWVAVAMAVEATAEPAFTAALMMTAQGRPLAGRLPEEEADAYTRSLLRDVFGHTIRPVALAPAWRTPTAVALARQMYDSRDFSPMPILADALQEAGCEDEQVLSHCRGPGPHVRGCFVADLVLGKS